MNKTQSIYRPLISFGVPVLLLLILFIVTKNDLLDTESKSISVIITLDLLLTIPFVYFLLIRKTTIPKTTIIPLMIVGLVVGSFILPSENQTYLDLFKTWALPLIELCVVTYIILKVRKTRAYFIRHTTDKTDFFTALKTTTNEMLPKLAASVFSMEIAIFYYGFFNWKKTTLKENEFSYHRASNTASLVSGIFVAILVEAIVLHILVLKWSVTASWILTGISIYSAIQIFGLLRSVIKRPIVIEENTLHLRYGIINETNISIADIEYIEWPSKSIDLDNKIRALSPLESMEGYNVIIHLNKETTLNGFYGIEKTFKSIAFTVDNKEEFKKQIKEKIS